MRKLSLEIETLSVESFETTAKGAARHGTVRGRESDADDPSGPTPPVELDACTCPDSCPCPTAAYYCATAPATVVSCGYTVNVSCYHESTDC